MPEGQARIATEKPRDKHDRIIVQEKLDGSCVSACKIGGEIIAIGRAGYRADTSRFEQHKLWANWVNENRVRFSLVLNEGERIVGEWLAQAHGTRYQLGMLEPFFAFDIMTGCDRLPFDKFKEQVGGRFQHPHLLSDGPPISVADAMKIHDRSKVECDQTEGVVYRVERKGEVDYLCKWVRLDKVDGKLLPDISGNPAVWNWRTKAN